MVTGALTFVCVFVCPKVLGWLPPKTDWPAGLFPNSDMAAVRLSLVAQCSDEGGEYLSAENEIVADDS